MVAGSSSRLIRPASLPAVFDIFDVGFCRSITRAAGRRGDRLREHERLAETTVEPDRDVTGDLDVLALVVADGHLVGVVQQDVGGLQCRVGEQPARDEPAGALGGLLLELDHPRQLADADVALHQPRQLRVLDDVALHEHRGHVGVEADAEERRRQLQRALTDDAGLVDHGQRVEVDDAVEHVLVVLAAHPVPQRPEVAAQMDVAGRLHARENPGHAPQRYRSGCREPGVDTDANPDVAEGRHPPPRGGGRVASDPPMAIDVATPVYEGPFDLLLQLILAEEVDLYEVSLTRIVDAYLAEIERLQALDLDVATEFLLIAATLVELKARRLLPGRADIDLDDELALWEERDLLLARLLECKTFKDVAAVLSALAEASAQCVARQVGPDERFDDVAPDLLAGVTIARLHAAALAALAPKPVPRIDLFHVAPIRVSVADAVSELLDELPRVGRITFARLTADLGERLAVIVRFLAVLELFKQGLVEVDQTEHFGTIVIEWSGGDPAEAAMALAVDSYDG